MMIAVLATVITAACLAEVARRAYLGRRTVKEMQCYEPPNTIRVLRSTEEMQGSLRRMTETEHQKARRADAHAERNVAVADSVAASSVTVPAVRPVPATA
jgi:hypothetical protein